MITFVDTNVIVYARDLRDGQKQARAEAWISSLWRSRTGRISEQVLNEFYVTVTQKLSPGLNRADARADVVALQAWNPVALDAPIRERAWQVQDRYGLSYWDSLIVSAAQASGCERLLTEDLQGGQDLKGLVVVNPFDHEPPM